MKAVLSLLLVFTVAQVFGVNYCQIQTGDLFSAVYGLNVLDPVSGSPTVFTIGAATSTEPPEHAIVEGTTDATATTFFSFWQIVNDENGQTVGIKARDIGSSPAGESCPVSVVGDYKVTWNSVCNQLVLSNNLINDTCVTRKLLWDGITLSLVSAPVAPKPCTIFMGLDASGRYGKFDESADSQGHVHFVFGANHFGSEVSSGGTVFVRWIYDPELKEVHVQDYASEPAADACGSGVVGIYSIKFDGQCGFQLKEETDDPCELRAGLYDGMKTNRDFELSSAAKVATSFSLLLGALCLMFA